jgi:hypothetical protein
MRIKNIVMETYSFEIVKEFTYLGSLLTARNRLILEVQKRINAGNQAHHVLLPLLKSRLIPRNTKKMITKP